ncbi:hypothetical protein THAOC_35662 [Thalassiosira oceanica]|uniref:NADP-dependent oxidoreductase domain-containing protein n=1 Tax=Thalassiosira oceanica TaxID=159749 RepID=K0R1D6_THAOC|nr:hypothetical protein THAOC_35662 [Thalassiosira oceanica]|eukprot:EJK45710.1 hypothetical protein THAOC_35662 [Thalassiosira oceanica]
MCTGRLMMLGCWLLTSILAYALMPSCLRMHLDMRLMAGTVIDLGLKVQACDTCGNIQLCAGLGAGIEGNLHAVTKIFPLSQLDWLAGWTEGEGTMSSLLSNLVEHGAKYGYNPKTEKCLDICMEEDKAVAKQEFLSRGLELQFVRVQRYLDGHVVSKESKEQYVNLKVEALAEIAKTHPQTVHAAFTFCLQHKWMYMCRVIPGIAQLLEC